jgi:hypothetical protein
MRNRDLFGLKRLPQVGPSDYDPNKMTKNSPKVIIKQGSPERIEAGSVKKQMETYLGKIFDQDGQQTNRAASIEQPSSMSAAAKALEKVAPFTVDKRDMSFKSKVRRDPMEPSREVKATPVPGAYNPEKPKRDLTQSKNYQ